LKLLFIIYEQVIFSFLAIQALDLLASMGFASSFSYLGLGAVLIFLGRAAFD
jgi:hypothetical protein